MTNNTVSSTSTKCANYFTFDHVGKRINGSEASFRKAEILGSAQYEALMVAMERHPSYTLTPIVSQKKVAKKQSYKGLTCDLMVEYVNVIGNEKQKAELDKMIDDKEGYPAIKSWFLDYYKVGFSVEKAKREIAYRKLKDKKATVRKIIKANMVKAEESQATAPVAVASNF